MLELRKTSELFCQKAYSVIMQFGGKAIARLMHRSLRVSKKLGSPRSVHQCAQVVTVRSFSDSSTDNGVPNTNINAVADSCLSSIDCSSVVEGMNHLTVAELGYSPSHVAIQCVENVHMMVGIPYWEAIALTTVAMRVILLPAAIIVARDVSKMRALKPEMKKIKTSLAKVSSAEDPTIRFKYASEINKLFALHNISPMKSMAISAFQFPVFITFLYGLREMSNYYPGYASGGDYWFTDLAAADPYHALPLFNALSFLIMLEIGAVNGQPNPLKWVRMKLHTH